MIDKLMDRKYIEHDAYALLSLIMKRLSPIFLRGDQARQSAEAGGGPDDALGHLYWVQNDLLRRCDPEAAGTFPF